MRFLILMILIFGGRGSAYGKEISETETFSVDAAGIESLNIQDLDFTTFSYTGDPEATEFSITFERIVQTDDRDEFERVGDQIHLHTDHADDRLNLRLEHPRQSNRGFMNHLFHSTEWRTVLTISGPAELDTGIESDFGEMTITGTTGRMRINASFTEVTIRSHSGFIDATTNFGGMTARDIDGGIKVATEFGNTTVEFYDLRLDSEARVNFGNIEISLPDDTDARITARKSISDITFDTRMELRAESGNTHVLGNGDTRLDLNAEFGKIRLTDHPATNETAAPVRSRSSWRLPLDDDARWEFSDNERSFTLRVAERSRIAGNEAAILECDGDDAPFERIMVYQTGAGLFLMEIDGQFFGRGLSGLRFDPPRLWLPYDSDTMLDDAVLGSVRVTYSDSDEFEFEMTVPDGGRHRIGVGRDRGFTRFDRFRLSGSDADRPRRTSSAPAPRPRFTRGALHDIDVRVHGSGFLDREDIMERLTLVRGTEYSREEIDDAVDELEDMRFVRSAHYRITPEGDMTVTVYESDLFDSEFDIEGSFNRVGGVGLGPHLTIDSMVGPFSVLEGGAQYHWSNKEWTYSVNAEKQLFGDAHQFFLGGGYRQDYESVLDWAVSGAEATANALIAGEASKHYYEVRGATGFAGFRVFDRFSLRAAYFDEEYSSLKKHTNWSILNHRHTKPDNLPLMPMYEIRYTGMRYTAGFQYHDRAFRSHITIEAEQGDPEEQGIPESYTRWLANAHFDWRMHRDIRMLVRFAGGYSDDNLPPQRAFRLGGVNTLRGYEFESVPILDEWAGDLGFLYGGNRMLLANWEYLVDLEDDIGLVLFADAGNAWINDVEVDLKDLRRDVGVGLVFGDIGDFTGIDDLDFIDDHEPDWLRINWAVPVGPVPHTSQWTVNFTRSF